MCCHHRQERHRENNDTQTPTRLISYLQREHIHRRQRTARIRHHGAEKQDRFGIAKCLFLHGKPDGEYQDGGAGDSSGRSRPGNPVKRLRPVIQRRPGQGTDRRERQKPVRRAKASGSDRAMPAEEARHPVFR